MGEFETLKNSYLSELLILIFLGFWGRARAGAGAQFVTVTVWFHDLSQDSLDPEIEMYKNEIE